METRLEIQNICFDIKYGGYTYLRVELSDLTTIFGRTMVENAKYKTSFEVEIWQRMIWQRRTLFIKKKPPVTLEKIVGGILI